MRRLGHAYKQRNANNSDRLSRWARERDFVHANDFFCGERTCERRNVRRRSDKKFVHD